MVGKPGEKSMPSRLIIFCERAVYASFELVAKLNRTRLISIVSKPIKIVVVVVVFVVVIFVQKRLFRKMFGQKKSRSKNV